MQADPSTLANQAVAEIKHGRIAMLTLLGYAAQAAVTGKGPLENLMDFIADPAHNNVLAYLPK
jgi:light-harvesting complex II chlorophyll a/b binding protein 7